MIEFLMFFYMLTGVCAPYDWTDCDWNLVIEDDNYTHGGITYETKTIHLYGDLRFYRDHWGQTAWEHEWRHAKEGSWHLNGHCCILR